MPHKVLEQGFFNLLSALLSSFSKAFCHKVKAVTLRKATKERLYLA